MGLRPFPELLRQFSAEALGTFLLVIFGDGAIAETSLDKSKAGGLRFSCALSAFPISLPNPRPNIFGTLKL